MKIEEIKKLYLQLKNPYNILFCIILILGIFFRFYNIPERYGFDYDAARDGLIATYGAQSLQFPYIGPPTSVGEFTFGPWYYIQLILFTIITPFHFSPWIYIGILSTIIIFVMYKIGEVIGGKTLGLVLGLLSAVTTSQITVATGLSNPNVILFFATLSLLCFLRQLKSVSSLWWDLLLGISLGFGLVSHYQMIGLFILPLLLFIANKNIKKLMVIGLGVSIAYLPLLFFDLQNNFYTTKGISNYLIHGTSNPMYVPNRWLFYLRDFWPQFWSYTLGVPQVIGISTIIISLMVFAYVCFQKKLAKQMLFFFIAFGINIIYFRYYSGERAIYYLYFFMPFVLITFGYTLWYLSKGRYRRFFGVVLLIWVSYFNIHNNMLAFKPTHSHLLYKEYTHSIKSNYPENISLYNCGKDERNRAYAIAFLLNTEKLIVENGRKIGIFDKDCQLVKMNSLSNQSIQIISSRDGVYTIDLTRFSQMHLRKTGWIEISPKTVYSSVLLWWMKDNDSVYNELRRN